MCRCKKKSGLPCVLCFASAIAPSRDFEYARESTPPQAQANPRPSQLPGPSSSGKLVTLRNGASPLCSQQHRYGCLFRLKSTAELPSAVFIRVVRFGLVEVFPSYFTLGPELDQAFFSFATTENSLCGLPRSSDQIHQQRLLYES